MSLSYWTIMGIGINQTDLIKYLDGDKLAVLVKEDPEFIVEDNELEKDYEFSTLSNKAKVKVLMDYYVCEYDWQLPELLQKKDEKNVLSCGDNNEGKYFLLYHPRYPWEEDGGFKSQNDVVGWQKATNFIFSPQY